MIPYGRQDISQSDIDSVVDVLKSDFLTQGPVVPRFEAELAALVEASFATAVNSATSALHIACAALGLGKGDWLWTVPNTFVASANCGLYCGAKIDFVDIDPVSFNMSVSALEAKLVQAKASGTLPKVVIPVHFSGQPCDMKAIGALASEYGFRVIEDASHAIGASYQGTPTGACEHSDITVFSFHPVKIITTGEGGVATTNDPELDQKMKLLRSHGVTRDPALMQGASDGQWYYQQVALGWNYRMTEMQAALGVSQLPRLVDFIARRHTIADRYDDAFKGAPITRPVRHTDRYSALHLYVIQVDDASIHGTVFDELREKGIGVNLHYIPVHLQPFYKDMGFANGDFPAAENYYSRAISIPMYPGLTDSDQDTVIAAVLEAVHG